MQLRDAHCAYVTTFSFANPVNSSGKPTGTLGTGTNMITVHTAASLALGGYTLTIRVTQINHTAQYVEHPLTVTVT